MASPLKQVSVFNVSVAESLYLMFFVLVDIALILNNAKVGSEIAVELAHLRRAARISEVSSKL